LTLEEGRGFLKNYGGALYKGQDQWVAIFDPEDCERRDWMQVGDKCHHPGKSHVLDCRHYPPWGDDKNSKTYGNPTWNHCLLWTTSEEKLVFSESNSKSMKKIDSKGGYWTKHQNIDMCGQGDVEILNGPVVQDIEKLRKICEEKGYSAISVGSFPHAALKKFNYQLTVDHCKPTKGYTNWIHIYHRGGHKKPETVKASSYTYSENKINANHKRFKEKTTWDES